MSNEQTASTADNETTAAPLTPQEDERPALVKKIGNTTYEVSFHFSTTSTETMSDKIKRLIKRDMSA